LCFDGSNDFCLVPAALTEVLDGFAGASESAAVSQCVPLARDAGGIALEG
jgi:hypothetical protein